MRQGQQGERVGQDEGLRTVPARTVEDEHGMGAGSDAAGNFRQVGIHRCGADDGQDQSRRNSARGADRAEKIGPLIAGIARGTGPGAASGPDEGERPLLTDPCFILEPDFVWAALGGLGDRRRYRRAEVFLNASCASGSVFGCCGRTESLR